LGMITRDCIRRGVFHSVPDLAHKIMTYIRLYNRNAQPFHWTYPQPPKAYSCITLFGNTTLVLENGWQPLL